MRTGFSRIELSWPGGEHQFELTIGDLARLQEICQAGPIAILNRLTGPDARIEDIRNVLLLGLERAGMPVSEARRTVTNAMDSHPLMEFILPARAVLSAAIIGIDLGDDDESDDDATGDDDGKKKA